MTRCSARARSVPTGARFTTCISYQVKKPSEVEGRVGHLQSARHHPRRRSVPSDGSGRLPAGGEEVTPPTHTRDRHHDRSPVLKAPFRSIERGFRFLCLSQRRIAWRLRGAVTPSYDSARPSGYIVRPELGEAGIAPIVSYAGHRRARSWSTPAPAYGATRITAHRNAGKEGKCRYCAAPPPCSGVAPCGSRAHRCDFTAGTLLRFDQHHVGTPPPECARRCRPRPVRRWRRRRDLRRIALVPTCQITRSGFSSITACFNRRSISGVSSPPRRGWSTVIVAPGYLRLSCAASRFGR